LASPPPSYSYSSCSSCSSCSSTCCCCRSTSSSSSAAAVSSSCFLLLLSLLLLLLPLLRVASFCFFSFADTVGATCFSSYSCSCSAAAFTCFLSLLFLFVLSFDVFYPFNAAFRLVSSPYKAVGTLSIMQLFSFLFIICFMQILSVMVFLHLYYTIIFHMEWFSFE
jgi:hypothetical protein